MLFLDRAPASSRRSFRSLAHVGWLRVGFGSLPPSALALLAMLSVQCGSAVGKGMFHSVGPAATAALRMCFAAVTLLLIWRPRLRAYGRRQLIAAAAFGLAQALMAFCIYQAINRLPLGVAVTIEFIGPLGVASLGSRRWLDALWVALAALGVLLLSPWAPGAAGGGALDPLGVGLALLAGAGWGGYILLSARVGRVFSGGAGLALATSVAALVLAPIGIVSAGRAILAPAPLMTGLAVGMLSTVIPFSLELEALRRMSTRVFGILTSLEPAVAGLIGLLALHETLAPRDLIAMALVTSASIGSARFHA